jgi:hypothetical protein
MVAAALVLSGTETTKRLADTEAIATVTRVSGRRRKRIFIVLIP